MIEVDFIDNLDSLGDLEKDFIEFFNDLYHCLFKLQEENYFVQFEEYTNKIIEISENDTFFELVLVDDKEIKELNNNFRKINKVTDVLSFSDYELIENKIFIGSVVISFDKAKMQAEEYGNSLLKELKFLSLHGFLHLAGFDHENDNGEMLLLQKKIKVELSSHFFGEKA